MCAAGGQPSEGAYAGWVKLVAAFVIVCAVLCSSAVSNAARAVLSTHRPVIISISVSRSVIPASGGRVVVHATAAFAKTCVFSGVSNPVKLPCADGSAAETIVFKPNSATTRRVWTIYVIGSGASGVSLRRKVRVAQSAATPIVVKPPPVATTPVATTPVAPTPPTAALSISASSVPSTGGSVTLSYSSSNASTCTLSSTPAFWTGADPATVNCNGSYAANAPATTSAQQWTFTFTATTSTGQIAVSSQMLTQAAPPASQNQIWSGYVLPSSALFTDASGAWTVPTLNCADTPSGGVSTWVGVGGYGWPTGGTSGALLQTGITDQCVNGSQKDSGWFEEVPSTPNYSRNFANFSVSPGDSITATVFQGTNGSWETKLDDLTTGLSGIMVVGEGWGVASDTSSTQTFPTQGSTVGLTYSGGYTAEWIVEDYTDGTTGSTVPLANYGTVTFTSLGTSLASWSLTPGEGLAIEQNGVTLSTPSAPSSAGFSVSYTGP